MFEVNDLVSARIPASGVQDYRHDIPLIVVIVMQDFRHEIPLTVVIVFLLFAIVASFACFFLACLSGERQQCEERVHLPAGDWPRAGQHQELANVVHSQGLLARFVVVLSVSVVFALISA